MFAPSFFSGHLISRFGVNKIMLTGAGLLAACVVVALSGISVTHFWVSLFLMGIGWNFLFVGGSTMLTTVYTTAERAKTQAAHDFMVFATTAGSSFLSGKLLHEFGWQTINYVAVPFIAGVTILVLWYAVAESRRDRPATSA